MPLRIIIIGGGIVGLATAYALSERLSEVSITVLEKESELALHQSGRNSGVIHSGIYYRPDSLKARNCRAGRDLLLDFCRRESVPFELCGKVIVAGSEDEIAGLESLYRRGRANGVVCEHITKEQLAAIEPHAVGLRALHVPEAGIVDYRAVCLRLASKIQAHGHRIHVKRSLATVRRDGRSLRIGTEWEDYEADILVNCAGVYADRVARLCGIRPALQIIPFRGDYFTLTQRTQHLCRGLIYPVPNPRLPFLGVHLTRMIGGGVECGPNAVLALAREAYRKSDWCLHDLWELLSYRGTWRLARQHWRSGLQELRRSLSKRLFARSLQQLLPAIREEDLEPRAAGIRAQALHPDGRLADDFVIQEAPGMIHVLNAPSPAATASLMIGREIAARVGA